MPPSPRILAPANPEGNLHRGVPPSPQISDPASPEGDPCIEASPRQESAWEETIAEIPFFEFDELSTGVQFQIGP